MLVALVLPVAGEVLDGGGKSVLLHLGNVCLCHFADGAGIGSEGARVGDGVAPVGINVRDRRERPVDAGGGSLRSADCAESPCPFRPSARRGGKLHGTPQLCPVGQRTAPACLQVCRNQQRDRRAGLQDIYYPSAGCQRHGTAHDAARTDVPGNTLEGGLVVAVGHKAEELSELVLRAHAVQGFLNPNNSRLVQMKGGTGQAGNIKRAAVAGIRRQISRTVGGYAGSCVHVEVSFLGMCCL